MISPLRVEIDINQLNWLLSMIDAQLRSEAALRRGEGTMSRIRAVVERVIAWIRSTPCPLGKTGSAAREMISHRCRRQMVPALNTDEVSGEKQTTENQTTRTGCDKITKAKSRLNGIPCSHILSMDWEPGRCSLQRSWISWCPALGSRVAL